MFQPTSRELHHEPFWLNVVRLYKLDELSNVYLTNFDHLRKQKPLKPLARSI